MSWQWASDFLDNSCISWLGGISVVFTPQNGSGPQTIKALPITPTMLDQYVPGGVIGTGTVWLFVRYVDITPNPQKGDLFYINSVKYNLQDAPVDTNGGCALKLVKC